ncbi:MAG: M20 family metallopeptidase [Rubripirellula sp.]
MQLEPVLDTLAELIRIKSVNPNYDDGVSEAEITGYIESFFTKHGIETRRQNVIADRDNLIATIPGIDRSRRIIFEAHVDTVSALEMSIAPFQPLVRDGKMHGRGSCDTKGGLAAMMHAMVSLHQQEKSPPCEVWFVAAVDEEFSYRGVAELCRELDASTTLAAIVAEPTELRSVIASKGLVRWVIRTEGVAAHSAKPHLGNNAIEQMAYIIQAIERDTSAMAATDHPLLGSATCNVGLIRGGIQINLVPPHCEIELDRRMLPGETPEGVLAHYQTLLDGVMAHNPQIRATMLPPMLTDVPLETPVESDAVRQMQGVLSSLDLNPEPIGVPFCSDASKFGQLGIPSMILGPGNIDQAHANNEFVDCRQVLQACKVYQRFMTDAFNE